ALSRLSAAGARAGADPRLPVALRGAGADILPLPEPPLSPLRSATLGLPRRPLGPGDDLARLPARVSLAIANPDGTLGPLDQASSDALRRIGYAAMRAAVRLPAPDAAPVAAAAGTGPSGPKRDVILVLSGRADGARRLR